MSEVPRGTDLVLVGERSEGEVLAGKHAAYLVATGTFAGPAPVGLPIENTGAAMEPLYDIPSFAGVIAGLSSLYRSEPPAKFVLPLDLEPEGVLGFRPLPGNPITTVASAPENMMIWGQEGRTRGVFREYFGPSGRTVISLIELPAPSRLLPSGRQALEDVAQWTGLAHEALGTLLGASRRSVYNWLRGRAMSSQFEARALRLRAALRPLAERRAPGEVANWLQAGVTPPAELVQEEHWEDFEALLREELMPRVVEPMAPEPEEGEPETYSAATRLAVLSALRTPPPVEQRRRPEWRPREVTGTLPLADDED